MCISPAALLSALVLRLQKGGARVTREELEAVLAAGCTREDLRAAFERGDGDAFAAARALLGSLSSARA
jgi:hypothetical protein